MFDADGGRGFGTKPRLMNATKLAEYLGVSASGEGSKTLQRLRPIGNVKTAIRDYIANCYVMGKRRKPA